MTAAVASPTLASTTFSLAGSATASTPEKLSGVAKQFEAIFLRQMLASARKSNFGDSLFSDSQSMDTFKQMQDERFADIAADTGAFGLGKMIETHLARFVSAETDPAKTGAATTDAAAKQETGNVL